MVAPGFISAKQRSVKTLRQVSTVRGAEFNIYKIFKRIIDFICASILIIPASLIILLCCIAIKIETKGPCFFVQIRPGYKGKLFKIYKLRTMVVQTQKNAMALSDIERTTKVGRIIRTYSFDELPQLINILKSEMSFIGPRPLLLKYLSLYTPEQMRRHDVLPGISGWAQVNGRNELSWDEKFSMDIWYVDHMCFSLDLKILCLTMKNLITHKCVNANSNVTMVEFTGSKM